MQQEKTYIMTFIIYITLVIIWNIKNMAQYTMAKCLQLSIEVCCDRSYLSNIH